MSRSKALEQVKLKYPEIFNGLLAKYKDDTVGFFKGLETGIELMCQEEGLGPGATETSWLYDLAVAPLIDEVQKTISGDGIEGIISTIIDDISIATTFDKMVDALNILVEKGKEVGYFINFDKTQYLMSPVDNHNELKESNTLKIKTDY